MPKKESFEGSQPIPPEEVQRAEEMMTPAEKRASIEREVESEEIHKIFEHFLGSEEIAFTPKEDVDTPWELSEEEKERLSMICYYKASEAVDWAIAADVKEIRDRCFSEKDERMWKELVLIRRTQEAIKLGLLKGVDFRDSVPDVREKYPELDAKSFYMSSKGTKIKAGDFDGSHPVFTRSIAIDYSQIFSNIERSESGPGTKESAMLNDIIDELSPDEAYALVKKISVLAETLQGYFLKKIGVVPDYYHDPAGEIRRFVEKYPEVVTEEGLAQLQAEGKVPETE